MELKFISFIKYFNAIFHDLKMTRIFILHIIIDIYDMIEM